MKNALKNNNQNIFDQKLFQIDCLLGRSSIIPLTENEINIIKNWNGFSNIQKYHYDYKGHLIFKI